MNNPRFYEDIEKICDKFGTPCQIYDESLIRENVRNLINAFSNKFNFKQLAVKALPNPYILKILLDEGCGLDCSSNTELKIAQQLGVEPHNIMFTSNYTSKEDLKLALDMKVIINLDDLSLIEKLYNINQSLPDTLFFRLNPGVGNTESNTKSNILGGPDAKFGISPNDIIEAFRLAKNYGVKNFGIHMMTGSCVLDNNYWEKSVNLLIDNIIHIEQVLEINIDYINIGGGIGIPYNPEEKVVDINYLVNTIDNCFKLKIKQLKIYTWKMVDT